MPPSQLKRLKASLREQGINSSKKAKKHKKKSHEENSNPKAQRNAALSRIQESFNPFEFKTLARPKKFNITVNRSATPKGMVGRPGVTKSLGEETVRFLILCGLDTMANNIISQRRRTLLPEMNKRNKIGGILDRRIGENDPTMTPDERMLERFTREKQRMKGSLLFDLEEAEDEGELTHLGRSLSSGKEVIRVDYDATSVQTSSDDDDAGTLQLLKRRRSPSIGADRLSEDTEKEQPKQKKSKAEIMKEVIAKSKFHKHERQVAKEEDDDLREELDKGLPDVLAALRGHLNFLHPLPRSPPKEALASDFSINPDRAALLNELSKKNTDKEYDEWVRQMLFDQRSKPTERTKTEDEKAEEEANLLKNLEEQRLRRMVGDPDKKTQSNQIHGNGGMEEDEDITDDEPEDDAAEFGFSGMSYGSRPVGVDDEDDFLVDVYTVNSYSESDIELSESSYEEADGGNDAQKAEDDEFLGDIFLEDGKDNGVSSTTGSGRDPSQSSRLAYTYPCPRSHEDFLNVLEDVPTSAIHTIIQRIRALYHPKLHHENKEMLADFAGVLVNHLAYVSSQKPSPPLAITETLIRHIHSLSRTFPDQIAKEFRFHLQHFHTTNTPTPGDLIILTAIGSIYPTSDHFHQVVTPAITLMARWLGITTPKNVEDLATGAYICALCLQYQKLSRRYIPELVRFTNIALSSPLKTSDLVEMHIKNLAAMADLWFSKSAFTEIFTPATLETLSTLRQTKAHQRLQILLNQARLVRRPLELHYHRPLPIKTAIPKFEEGFNPDKHYDPDLDRANASKLQAEYKREKKGALRELRKDANFIAREKLREKKEKDKAYEAKYKRLVAEIQGDEGREKNAYDREKRARKGKL